MSESWDGRAEMWENEDEGEGDILVFYLHRERERERENTGCDNSIKIGY